MKILHLYIQEIMDILQECIDEDTDAVMGVKYHTSKQNDEYVCMFVEEKNR